jgi:hypothetical protein
LSAADQKLIKSAMQAAPKKVSAGATIVTMGADNHWVKTGPHVMIVGADTVFYDMYPKSATPDTSVPYVMWAGTPYQHLMIPVK